MEVKVMKEAGYNMAVAGIGLSFNLDDMNRLYEVADKLAPKDGGHNKFLESMVVWLDIDAARYWWSEFDTYRVGTTKQSESTMHTITKGQLAQEDFEEDIFEPLLIFLNNQIHMYNAVKDKDKKNKYFKTIKNNLPEGFLQRRIVCTNYKVLKNMFVQRKNHRLQEWHTFIDSVLKGVQHPEFLETVLNKEK